MGHMLIFSQFDFKKIKNKKILKNVKREKENKNIIAGNINCHAEDF